ncbi:MAG: T9SS type A sorting domain-containing protein [Ignavibacteriaceae bacterium]
MMISLSFFRRFLPVIILTVAPNLNAQFLQTNFLSYSNLPISAMTITTDNKLFVGSAQYNSGGVYTSSDTGKTWDKINDYYMSYPISSMSSNGNGRILVCNEFWPNYSKDEGSSWSNYNLGLVGEDYGEQNIPSGGIVSPNNSIFVAGLYLGFQTQAWIARSTDDGVSWGNLSISYEEIFSLTASDNNFIYAFAEDFGSPEVGVTGPSYLIRSTDNGNNWKNIFTFYNDYSTVIPENFNSLSSCFNGNIFFSSNLGIYRSTNYGDNWVKIDSLSNHTEFENFTFYSDSYGSVGFASNSYGIFSTKDNGQTWICIDSSLQATAMAVGADNYLYVGTSKLGLLRSTFSIKSFLTNVTNHELKKQFLLEQNYPNPFNPTTTINYSLPEPGIVTIKLYDIVGREIKTLINEGKSTGNYSVQFNGSNLASGVYFYRMQSGSFVETKKLILMK